MDKDTIISELYYSPTGFSSIQNLYNQVKLKDKTITLGQLRSWLKKQNLTQMFNTSEYMKTKSLDNHGHFYVFEPNKLHMIDILYLPHDNKYKYALCLIDVATRYKAAQAIRSRTQEEVCRAIKLIYQDKNFKFPQQLNCDNGPEFKGKTKLLYERNGTVVNYSEPGYHRSQVFVEVFNRTLAKRLFTYMYSVEMNKNIVFNGWVNVLQDVVGQLNNEVNSSTHMTPVDAMKLDYVNQKMYQVKDIDDLIPIGTEVRYKLAPDEIHDISSSSFDHNGNVTKLKSTLGVRRATDPIYSITKHKVLSYKQNIGQPITYRISGKKRPFTGAELQISLK